MTEEEVRSLFRERYGREPRVAIAPGRVNLIGEHTDYNEGFVLPAAIDRYCLIAFDSGSAGLLRGYSVLEREERSLELESLARTGSWLDYVAGMIWAHREAGIVISGMDFVVGGDLPAGAGLSSSAALELATARAISSIAGSDWDPEAAARRALRAENEFVGVPCGIMDPMAVALSEQGSALLIDCRTETVELVPIPPNLSIVVLDTGTRRALASSAYEERRRSCERAAELLGVPSLREAALHDLSVLTELLRRRALHVVEENRRTLTMTEALKDRDESRIGSLMAESHTSLRDLFEVSSPALDAMVAIASRHPAAVGARMTGAGFGGSAVALVRERELDHFLADVESGYSRETGNSGKLYTCRAVEGARLRP